MNRKNLKPSCVSEKLTSQPTKETKINRKVIVSKIMLGLTVALCFNACKKPVENEDADASPSVKSGASTSAVVGYDIMCTNNSNNKLELFNYGDTDWNAAGALKWSWMPTTGLGYTSTEVSLWTNGDPTGDPMDAKRVTTSVWSGTSEVLVSVGGQIATIARYATTGTKGSKIWAINVGAGAYPHSSELIPNGNLAVAAAHGDWVRVYNTTGTNYANFPLVGAHGTVWDPVINRLWVVGDTKLTALIIGGTRAAPTITEDTGRTKTIPGNGHDLSVFEGDNNKLWVTNSNNVYVYNKTTKVLTNAPGSAYRTTVKAVSNNVASTGFMIVETRPSTGCTLNTWCTPTVDFYNSAGTFLGSRTKSGAAYYKADVWANDAEPPIEDCDFNGDAKSEQAFFNNGVWKVYGSSDVTNGIAGDIAVPGDYNGDGTTDKVVYRPATGYWYNLPGTSGGISWGQANTDIPVPGDYDGNGSTEVVVFRPSTGQWLNYTGAYNLVWGQAGDIPVPGDYDGAGITDMCVYRPSNFTWYVRTNYPQPNGSLIPAVVWGQAGDIPVPGDYNGDSMTDMTVYRPSTGQWFPSTNGTGVGSLPGFPVVFGGTAGDIPAPGDYVGDGKTDLSYYRSGTWYINGGTNVVFGNIPGGDKLVNLPWSIRKFYFP